MAIIVYSTLQDFHADFPTATKWHIDDERQLHVIADGGDHLAAFGAGQWSSVHKVQSPADVR